MEKPKYYRLVKKPGKQLAKKPKQPPKKKVGAKSRVMVEGLNPKHHKFAMAYCRHLNISQAAREAGYSAKTAGSAGSQLLNKPDVAEFVKRKMDETSMSATEAVRRMSDWGRATIEPFLTVNEDTMELTVDLSSDLAKESMYMIKKIKQTDTIVRNPTADNPEVVISRKWELELHSAPDAVDKILRVHGKYTDNLNVSVDTPEWDPEKGDAKEYVKRKLNFSAGK